MTAITLKPNESLSPFARDNLQKLQFDQTPLCGNPTVDFEKPDLTWFGRCVNKIYNADSKAAKIAKVVAVIFLTCSVVGIPLLRLFAREANRQDSTVEKLDMQIAQINMRGVMVEKLGLDEFEEVPQLDLGGRMGSTEYIDFIRPDELTQPIMKGVDKFGRPFIAIKLKDEENQSHVLTLFQRYTKSDFWTWCSDNNIHAALEETGGVREETKDSLRKIITGETVKGLRLDVKVELDTGKYARILQALVEFADVCL